MLRLALLSFWHVHAHDYARAADAGQSVRLDSLDRA